MQTIDDTLTLLRRQAEIESAMKHPGGIRITEEQELHNIRRQLERFPEAMEAIVQAAHALRKPVSNLTSTDVEAWARHDKVA
jgi:hypothetical protein